MKSRIQIGIARVIRLLPLIMLLALPTLVRAQFTFTTNNGALTITGYTGPGGNVVIPGVTNDLPITVVGASAFYYQTNVISIMLPNSVTNIEANAFHYCTNLISVTIPNGVINIGNEAFYYCLNLTNVAIPNTVISIGANAFGSCRSLTRMTIPDSVTTVGNGVFVTSGVINVTVGNSVTNIWNMFFAATNLRGAYFRGNAPAGGGDVFYGINDVQVYYFPGTSGWGPMFHGRATMLWNPQVRTHDASFGVQTNGFGFRITGTMNIPIVIEAGTNLTNSTWALLQSCTLTNASIYFSDPQWTNHPARFYRLRWP